MPVSGMRGYGSGSTAISGILQVQERRRIYRTAEKKKTERYGKNGISKRRPLRRRICEGKTRRRGNNDAEHRRKVYRPLEPGYETGEGYLLFHQQQYVQRFMGSRLSGRRGSDGILQRRQILRRMEQKQKKRQRQVCMGRRSGI